MREYHLDEYRYETDATLYRARRYWASLEAEYRAFRSQLNLSDEDKDLADKMIALAHKHLLAVHSEFRSREIYI